MAAKHTLDAALRLRLRMAELTNTNAADWFLVAKARQGMQVAFEVCGRTLGRSEVVTQLFTCVTAITPILAAGLTPRYVDVDPQTLSIDPVQLEATERTAVVVLQHTFGIVDAPSSEALCASAHAVGALVVEDSAHCVGKIARDASGAPLADISVHSFGVEKLLPGTYFGGAVWVNPALADSQSLPLRLAFKGLPEPDRRLNHASRNYLNQVRVLTRLPQGPSRALRARWERKGTFEPAVSDEERRGVANHEPSQPSPWMCEQALAALDGLAANEANRLACMELYRDALAHDDLGDLFVPEAARSALDQPLLRLPAFATDATQAQALKDAVQALGLYVPDWPRPLLVPGVLDPAPFGLAQGTAAWPTSELLSATVVPLPTDVDPSQIPDIVHALHM